MAQWIRHWLCKLEDQNTESQSPCQSQQGACLCSWRSGDGDKTTQGKTRLTQPSSSCSLRPWIGQLGGQRWRKTPSIHLWLQHAHGHAKTNGTHRHHTKTLNSKGLKYLEHLFTGKKCLLSKSVLGFPPHVSVPGVCRCSIMIRGIWHFCCG